MERDFAGVPENEKRAMLVDNCVKYFRLNEQPGIGQKFGHPKTSGTIGAA
jgi:hypothetical protein